MILEQHYLACLSQASYFIADETAGVAAIVDPRRDIDVYLERARELGVEIRHVLLTHFHADFLAGHLELAERTGATIHLGARGQAEYDFKPFAEGDALQLGAVRIEALETPGHTPESVCYLVFDGDAQKPHAVLTGDTLFIGDVGRPDLMVSKGLTKEELAGMMYDSLRQKLLPLPDETLVYPGHGAGSACGKNLSTDTSSTIGDQRALNWALQDMPKDEFVRTVGADQPTAPAYFPVAAERNTRLRPTLDDVVAGELRALDYEDFLAAADAGAQVLDTRNKDAFAAGHLAGSVNVGLDGRFASWAGTVLDLERPLLVIAEPGTEREVVTRLGRIGIDSVQGYLAGGIGELPREFMHEVERVDVITTAAELDGVEPPTLLDVRAPGEVADAHIAGSLSIPLAELTARIAEVPRDGRLCVHCKTGYRSMTAVSMLAAAGIEAVDVEGGIDAWTRAGLPAASSVQS